jgi:putative spermidine/putrescine transport system permease protein
MRRIPILAVYTTVFYVFILAPIFVTLFTSLNASRLNLFPPRGLSLRWYDAFFQSGNFTHAFAISIKLAVIVALVTGVLALAAAYALSRYRFKGRTLVQTLLSLPLMIPHMMIGIALLLFFAPYSFADQLRIVVGHVIIAMPITVRAITSSMDGVDISLEEAARSLGAGPLEAFRRVMLPLTGSGVLAGMLFAFTLSFTDANVALFLTGPNATTLPIEVFTYLQWESTPLVAAIATLQVALVLVIALIINKLVGLNAVMRH